MTLDTRILRDTLGLFVTGVTVITTVDRDGAPVGLTANSFNSVSLDPPLVLWSIDKASRALGAFSAASNFAVHILREDQAPLSQTFAQSGIDKFLGLEVSIGLGGIPLLPEFAARLECSVFGRYPAGDHIIFVAQIERLEADKSAKPLVYHGGKYATLADY